MAAATTPAPRAFALNVLADHYYGLNLAVSVAGADDRYAPQRLANVLLDTRGRQFFLQDCEHQPEAQPPSFTKDAAAATAGVSKPAAPRQQAPPASLPPPSCLSATLLTGGAAGGVGSGRLLECFVDEDAGGNTSPSSVQGSAYLSIELGGCYLAEGSVGLLDAGAGTSVAGAWPFSSAPAAPVALVLGNYSTPAAAAALGPVQILTPGSRPLPLDADEAALAATRPTDVVIEGFAGLAPRLGRRSDAAPAGGDLLNVVAETAEGGNGRRRQAQGSVTRVQPSLVALDLNAPPAPSTLTVDTWDETRLAAASGTNSSRLQWSLTTMEELYGGQIRGQAFPIFGLSVCGTPVFGTRSSSWLAVIDTLDPCMTLPAQAFDTVRAWALNTSLPLPDAGASTDLCYADAAGNYLCHLPASNIMDLGAALPALTFRLRQQPGGSGEGSEPALLTLPLSDLVLEPEPSNPNRTLCLIRGPELNEPVSPTGGGGGGGGVGGEKHVNVTFSDGSGGGSGGAIAGAAGAGRRRRRLQDVGREYQTNPIVLGTRALRSLYVVLDLENHRVGMANKAGAALPPAGYGPGCAAAAGCVGQDTYNPQRNLCEPPPCGRYMFHEPDPHDLHSCRVRPFIKFAFALACVLLVLAELLTHQWRAQAAHAVVARKRRQRERRLAGSSGESNNSNSSSRTGQDGGLRRRVEGPTSGGGGGGSGAPAGAG